MDLRLYEGRLRGLEGFSLQQVCQRHAFMNLTGHDFKNLMVYEGHEFKNDFKNLNIYEGHDFSRAIKLAPAP